MTATMFWWALMLSQRSSRERVFTRARISICHVVNGRTGQHFFGAHRRDRASISQWRFCVDAFRRRSRDGGGLRWFAAYGVVIAIGLSAAAVAIAVTIVLFRPLAERTDWSRKFRGIIGAGS